MNSRIAKNIFSNKVIAEECLERYRPHLFELRTPRCKKKRYAGNNVYQDLCGLSLGNILEFTREYSVTKGKYKDIHEDPDYFKSLIDRSRVDKSDSPCHPERFSESVIKPLIRKYICEKRTDDLNEYITSNITALLIKHATERINQQTKADWSEYVIMMNCTNIIPTLKHNKGTDMYLVNDDGTIEDLDVKTTRTIWDIPDKKEAIKKLYEKQGEDRFSSNPRLYIYLSDKELCGSENIIQQMCETYNVEFTYGNTTYNVSGCRLIVI